MNKKDVLYKGSITLAKVNDGPPGKDGNPGEPGSPGKDGIDGGEFFLDTNAKEILKVYTSQENLIIKPDVFTFRISSRTESLTGIAENPLVEVTAHLLGKPSPISIQVKRNDNLSWEFNLQQLAVDNILDGFFQIKIEAISKDTLKPINIIEFYNYRFQTTLDLARLSVNADSITQAIGSTKVVFNSNGLNIIDGGLKIYKKNQDFLDSKNPVFFADEEGNLHIKGYITAEGGSFTGEITAEGGTIGGFKISKTQLESIGDTGAGKIILNGADGKIIAPSISIGKNAEIVDYIKLGNFYLCNPQVSNGTAFKVLEGEKEVVNLKENGTLTIGNFTFRGSDSTIGDKNGNINLQSDGTAIFKKIKVENALISNSIVENNRTEVISGSLLLRESGIIQTIGTESNFLTPVEVETEEKIFNEKDLVYITYNSYANFFEIKKIEGSTIYLSRSLSLDPKNLNFISIPLINTDVKEGKGIMTRIGSLSQQFRDYILSLNGGSANSNPFLHSHSLALTSILQTQDLDYSIKKELVLGDLSGIQGHEELSGVGLYAQNAYLNGSLTTENYANHTYAGINTLSNSVGSDNSPIVFWAGASSLNDITDAPFSVTSKGYLRAQAGRFEGGIITDSIIEAPELKAARILGTGEDPALKILYDNNDINKTGISFCEKNGEKEREILSISATGLHLIQDTNNNINVINDDKIISQKRSIIQISSNGNAEQVSFEGDTLSLKYSGSRERSYITPKQFAFQSIGDNIKTLGSLFLAEKTNSANLNDECLGLQFKNQQELRLTDDGIELEGDQISIYNKIVLINNKDSIVGTFVAQEEGFNVFI